MPQQLGRARADLQYRLAEASPRLTRTAQARYGEGTGRLERALRDAADARQAGAADAAARDRALAGRLAALEQVLSRLDLVIAGPEPAALVEGSAPR